MKRCTVSTGRMRFLVSGDINRRVCEFPGGSELGNGFWEICHLSHRWWMVQSIAPSPSCCPEMARSMADFQWF
jgi:hypothetical protein